MARADHSRGDRIIAGKEFNVRGEPAHLNDAVVYLHINSGGRPPRPKPRVR
jgi:hypothetical protein